jgi:hypothetical protein
MYGPITSLRHNNRLVKQIPWSAFRLTEEDWARVVDARDILGVIFLIPSHSYFAILISLSGFKSYPAVFFIRKTTNPLARSSHAGRTSNGMGEEV